jgi:hypothetical protein
MGMRAALAESLEHIHSVAAGHMNLAKVRVAEGMSEIRAHRVGPGVFGRYYDLVFAVQSQRYDDAGTIFREILDLAFERPNFTVLPFTVEALGTETERYARLLGLEAESRVALAAPGSNEWLGFEKSVTVALKLIEQADATLASELRAVVIQIVGAIPATQNGGRGFGGASSFMLWGAVLLNVRQHRTKLDMIAGLVHEAAHQLLFGLSYDEPLVENPIEERYGSPLRTDPRPVDGIFHATFVCARVHYAYARLIQVTESTFSQADCDLIEQRLREYRGKFFDGLETLQRFGRMTANGDRILSAAADYMRSAN